MVQQSAMKPVPSLSIGKKWYCLKSGQKNLISVFISEVTQTENCPEFNGNNTANCRKAGHKMQPKTHAVYLPLIDMPLSDPDTICTTLHREQEMTEATGQKYTVITFDMHIYKVVQP